MTPAEKKASEELQKFLDSEQQGNPVIVNHFEYQKSRGFLAGFHAALELAEVKGMVDKHEQNAHQSNCELCCASERSRGALTAWRSFRGEK